MMEEQWAVISEFPNYEVSNFGEIYNIRTRQIMRTSLTIFGHVKITLKGRDGERYTRSVAQLVADAFVERPNMLCDKPIILDGNFRNVRADNLAWRPRWYAWKYTRQLKKPQPAHYQNLVVVDKRTGMGYRSILEAGIAEGLLFDDIYDSTWKGMPIFPYGSIFEVLKRV